jgi:hypothetical protein
MRKLVRPRASVKGIDEKKPYAAGMRDACRSEFLARLG